MISLKRNFNTLIKVRKNEECYQVMIDDECP